MFHPLHSILLVVLQFRSFHSVPFRPFCVFRSVPLLLFRAFRTFHPFLVFCSSVESLESDLGLRDPSHHYTLPPIVLATLSLLLGVRWLVGCLLGAARCLILEPTARGFSDIAKFDSFAFY